MQLQFARMAELADALDSGSSVRKDVQVQVLFLAPPRKRSKLATSFYFSYYSCGFSDCKCCNNARIQGVSDRTFGTTLKTVVF